MRNALIITLSLIGTGLCQAQSTPPNTGKAQAAPAPAAPDAIEKKAERIRVEDSGARIDELRIGGETKSIDVKPKGGMPAYQVQPVSGERSWKVLGF